MAWHITIRQRNNWGLENLGNKFAYKFKFIAGCYVKNYVFDLIHLKIYLRFDQNHSSGWF